MFSKERPDVLSTSTGREGRAVHARSPNINLSAVEVRGYPPATTYTYTVQYSSVQYSILKYSSVQYSTVQYSTVVYSTV